MDDRQIRRAFDRCGIPAVGTKHIVGVLGPFTFERGHSYYWIVNGPMPIAIARELYAHPVGATDIRADGDCGCRPPDTWAEHYADDGVLLSSDPDGKQEALCKHLSESMTGFAASMAKRPVRFVRDAAAVAAKSFVESYHIDSELGLYVFVEAIKRHGLV